MNKWIAVTLIATVLGIIWALYNSGEKTPQSANAAQTTSKPRDAPSEMADFEPPPSERPKPTPKRDDDEDAPRDPQVLDPQSEEFIERIDDIIPNRLYAEAANRCDSRGQHRDEKIKLWVHIRAMRGEIDVTEVKVLNSTIKEPALEACLRDAVKNARWRDEEMPEWEDDDEILIRIRGLKKHRADQDDEEE